MSQARAGVCKVCEIQPFIILISVIEWLVAVALVIPRKQFTPQEEHSILMRAHYYTSNQTHEYYLPTTEHHKEEEQFM